MIPVPRVSVRNSVRSPISPRAGTRYSIRTQPLPWPTMCSSRPLRTASSWVTAPTYSSGTSIERRSTGSWRLPSISLLDDVRLADCHLEALAAHHLDEDRELQLAAALDLEGVRAVGRHDAQRNVADQLLAQPVLDLARGDLVALLAGHGEVLTPIVIDIAGSSTVITGSGCGFSGSASVSPIVISFDAGDGDDFTGPGLSAERGRAPR